MYIFPLLVNVPFELDGAILVVVYGVAGFEDIGSLCDGHSINTDESRDRVIYQVSVMISYWKYQGHEKILMSITKRSKIN